MVAVDDEVVTRGVGCLAIVSPMAAANPFAHFASFIGRQFVQDFFAFTQAQPLQKPDLLHLQHAIGVYNWILRTGPQVRHVVWTRSRDRSSSYQIELIQIDLSCDQALSLCNARVVPQCALPSNARHELPQGIWHHTITPIRVFVSVAWPRIRSAQQECFGARAIKIGRRMPELWPKK